MSSSYTFVGASFRILSAASVAGGKVRARFTAVPLQTNPAGANDALNPANYTLAGPTASYVVSVATVGGDPDAVDLTVSPLLTSGHWTLTVANIQTVLGSSLTAPFVVGFDATATGTGTALTAGAENDDPSQIIRKHLSRAMGGTNWDALIAALGSGDDTNWDNARLAFDQLFKSSGSGKYLDRLMANDGISRPRDVGMSDEIFRDLGIALTNNKLTHESLREILEVYYGPDAMHAYAETELLSAFVLEDGLTLTWTIDELAEFTHTFLNEQFTSISSATAFEIAALLTKTMSDAGSLGYAAAVVDPATGLSKVRLYSGSIGLKSFVRVTGGTAQPYLRFPTYKEVYSGTVTTGSGYNWIYTVPSQNVTRISLTTAGQPLIDISGIEAGDYVVIGANVGAITRATYQIRDVYYSWTGANLTQVFELDEDLGVGSTTILQNANDNYRFFTATKRTILNGERTVVVAQTKPDTVDVQIPATTQAVSRTARTGSYPTGQTALSVERYWRDDTGLLTFKFASALPSIPTAGQRILIDNVAPAISRPWTSLGTPGTYPAVGTSDASFGTCWSATQAPPADVCNYAKATLLLNGDLLITGGTRLVAGVDQAEQDVCNRYRPVSTVAVADGSEADGATRQTYQWIATASMLQARFGHAVTTLLDGRALSTGGKSTAGSFVYPYVELYDPAANTWTTMPPLTTSRFDHRQITANNGKVIVIGGASNSTTALSSVEVFDPGTLTWSAGASMSIARNGHNAVKLADGRIFVTGGGQLTLSGLANINKTFNVGGGVTDTTAFYDPVANTWTEGPKMRYARHWHQMHLLPDNKVLVFGGWGRTLSEALPGTTPAQYPNNGLYTAEIWDPNTNLWSMCEGPSQNYTDAASVLLPTSQKIVVTNTNYLYDHITYGVAGGTSPDLGRVEVFDCRKKKWSQHYLLNAALRDYGWHVGSDIILYGGGIDSSDTTDTTYDLWIARNDQLAGGGINGVHEVVSATSTTISIRTHGHTGFATNFGDPDRIGGRRYTDPAYSHLYSINYNNTPSGYRHVVSSATRASNVTTLTVENIVGLLRTSTTGLVIGQKVYVNLNNALFPNGLKTLTAVTATSVSYAEVAANVGATAVVGAITVNLNAGAIVTLGTPSSTALGPYVFDPDAGMAITRSDTSLQTALLKGQQVDRIAVTSTADFPDEEGYIVLAFGTSKQSRPIKYLEKVGSNILLLDFSYVIEHDYPVTTTKVSLLDSREPYVPEDPLDSANLYATGSNAGRLAAQSTTLEAAAAGITVDFTVVYPGDRGLGGEGYPTEGDGKLSDVVRIWGGDE